MLVFPRFMYRLLSSSPRYIYVNSSIWDYSNIRLSTEPYLGFALSGKFKSGDEETMIKIGEENGAINGDLRDKNYGVRVGTSLQFGMFEPYAGYDIGLGDVIYGPGVAYSNGLYFGLALHL